ncbi:MAG: cell wall biosis protein [Bacteroidetes bacterium]|nr:cell wall biosis protein [Bacteroidota bacterium]
MRTRLLYILLIFTGAFYLQSCSDKDAPTDADENFVTSATFTIGGKTYEATIVNNEIIIVVPYTVSLKNATVQLTHTSSAKILPDPATITDWDNERIFRVTSYNGDENKYTYRVIKDDIRQEGDVTLANAAQITAFAESGVTIIKGNLTIGTDDGESIENITELSKLKQVEGNLTIKNSYKGSDLTGLDQLTLLGGLYIGSEEIPSTSPLYQVSLPALTTLTGNMSVCNNATKWVMLQALTQVGGNITLHSSSLQSIQMEKLQSVTANFNIQSATDEDGDGVLELSGTMASLNLPQLTTVGGTLSANYLAALKSIHLDKLETAGAILFKTLPTTFETINLPAIKTVEGDLNITSSTTEIAIGSIVNRNETLTSFDGFSNLQKVGGTLTFANFINVSQLPPITTIKELGGYYLFHLDKAKTSLDFSQTSFLKQGENDCELKISYTPITKIIGKAIMDCKLIIDGIYLINGIPDVEGIETINDFKVSADTSHFKELESATFNIKHVLGNLYIDGQTNYENGITSNLVKLINLPNLESVNGYFYLGNSNIFAPNLQTVGGQMYIKYDLTEFNLAKLTTVGRSNSPQYLPTGGTEFSFDIKCNTLTGGNVVTIPQLKEVGGKGVSINVGGSTITNTGLNCPKLETVDGRLFITGGLNPLKSFLNKTLTTLSLPALKKAGSVTIQYFSLLSNFSDFGTLFTNNSLEEGKWTVTKCKYNPTYQNMKDKIYAQP